MLFGITASFLIIQTDIVLIITGAILLFYKNVLDKVDGSLARAKGMDSRRGRFYDSLSDFVVNVFLFSAIAVSLYLKHRSVYAFAAAYLAMISSMLQCSFFVYYQVSFIISTGKKTVNRQLETITDEDTSGQDKLTLLLQRIFQLIYGWQDLIIYKLDLYLKNKKLKTSNLTRNEFDEIWYKANIFLTISSLLSIGTHMFLIALFAVFQWFEAYLFINLILMNLLLICLIIYKLKLV